MWVQVKKFMMKHRSKILTLLGIATVGYLAYNHFGNDSNVKLSTFVHALKDNHVEEVVIQGQTIYFKGSAE